MQGKKSQELEQNIKLAYKKAKDNLIGEARDICEDILSEFPHNKKIKDLVKKINSGNIAKSSKIQNPSSTELQYVINLHTEGRPQQALEATELLLKEYPDSPVLFNTHGIISADLSMFDIATNDYEQALKRDPSFSDAHNNLGILSQKKEDFEGAINHFKKAIQIDPKYAEAYNNLGVSLIDKGEVEAAIENFNKALQINRNYFEAYFGLGCAAKKLGDFKNAQNNFEAALKIEPDHIEALFQSALTAKEQGFFKEATPIFERVMELDVKNEKGSLLHLANMGVAERPSQTPRDYLKNYYRAQSKNWDIDTSKYFGHYLIKEAIKKTIPRDSKVKALDLGCGTGSLAKFLLGYAEYMDGVDLSEHMLKKADSLNLYDNLYEEDIVSFLANNDTKYDLITAAATLIHFGELDTLFKLVQEALSPSGKFVFSVFDASAEEIELNQFQLYSHSAAYINKLANKLNFISCYNERALHEYQGEDPVFAQIFVLELINGG